MDLTVTIITVGYVAFIFTIGVLTSKKIHNTDDFLLAGRNVGWFFLACTLGATVVGGGYSIGAVGQTYEMGILMLVASMGGYLQFVFSGLVVAPKFRQARVYTVAGYMNHRFGAGPRTAALVLSLLFSVFVIAAQMAAIGHVIAAMLPDLAENENLIKWAVILGGVIVIIYSAAGGLKAVIITDVFQFLILLAGFAVTALLVLPEVSLSFDASLGRLPETFFNPTRHGGWIYMGSLFLTFLLGETFAPGYATRFCAGKSKRDIQIGIGGVGILLTLLMPVIVFLIAVYARLHFQDIPPDRAMAAVIQKLNHPVIAGVIIAALISAVMSSADSALNSTTAIFIKDIFEQYFSGIDLSDKKTLLLSRVLTVGLGVLAIVLAVLTPNVIKQLLFAYHVWAPGIIVPILVGAVFKLKGPVVNRNLTITMIAGPVSALLHRSIDYGDLTRGPVGAWDAMKLFAGKIDPAVIGVLIAAVLFILLTVVAGIRDRLKQSRAA